MIDAKKCGYRCKCPHCNYEWLYSPINIQPKLFVSCPKCRTTFSFSKHCESKITCVEK